MISWFRLLLFVKLIKDLRTAKWKCTKYRETFVWIIRPLLVILCITLKMVELIFFPSRKTMGSFDSRDCFRVFIGRWKCRIENVFQSNENIFRRQSQRENDKPTWSSIQRNDNNIIIISTVQHVAKAAGTIFVHEKWKQQSENWICCFTLSWLFT